jgi:hypothetical protein
LHSLAHGVPCRPIVTSTRTLLVDVEVFRVVDVAIRSVDDAVDHSRLQVQHDRAWDVARIVGLVEEDIFAIAAGMRSLSGVRM